MPELFERARPQQWSDVAGQDSALRTIGLWRQRGEMTPRKVWLQGASGTGKTTIARLYAHEIADPICVTEIDAGDLTEAKAKELVGKLRASSLFASQSGKRGRALIVNEAHRMKKEVVGALLTLMETDFPEHAAILFTTTTEGAEKFEDGFDAAPFLSRCSIIELARRGIAAPFAKRAAEVAIREGLVSEGTSQADAEKAIDGLMKRHGANLRAIYSRIDSGALLVS